MERTFVSPSLTAAYGEKVKAYLRRGARPLPGFTEYPNSQAKCVAAKKSKKKKWMIELSKNLRQFKMKVVRIMKRTDNMLDAKQVLGVVEQFTVALDLLGDYTHQRKKRPLISCTL